MVSKPTSSLDWTEGNPDQATISVEPNATKKEDGWEGGEQPPAETTNWQLQNTDEWIKYLTQETDRNQYGQFSILDNQSSAVNITDLIADKTKYQNWSLEAYFERNHVGLAGIEDTAFYTNLGTGLNSSVYAIAVQSDGKILAGGSLTSFDGNVRNRLIRLNSDGTEDADFYTNLAGGFNLNVLAIKVQSDGKILVGGTFTTLGGNTRNRLVRLNSDGTEDTAFYTNLGTGFSGNINIILTQSDGKILAGGSYTTFNGSTRNRLVRLNEDGTQDNTFYTNLAGGFASNIYKLCIQSDGKILAGGSYISFGGNTRNKLVRLNSDGTEDTAFYTNLGTGFSGSVYEISTQSDGKILVGGTFTTLDIDTRNKLVRLNSDGTEDAAFYTNLGTGFDDMIYTASIKSDGKILIGGYFTTLDGNTRNRLMRLNSDGTEDTSFYTNLGTGFDAAILSLNNEYDDNILVGGHFIDLDGNTRNYLVRLDGDFLTREKRIYTIDKDDVDLLSITEQYRDGDVSGVTLSIDDTTGQVEYTSSNVGGTLVTSELYYALRNGKVFQKIDEATSTKSGLVKAHKQYTQSDVTFSSTPTGWSVNRAILVPYQTVDGAWRLKLTVDATMTTATDGSFTISGTTFKTSFNQAGNIMFSNGWSYSTTTGGNGTVGVGFENNSTIIRVSGDFELDSKPTWAY